MNVVSSGGESTDYELTIEVLPPETGPVVYLTFDDGPHPSNTPQMLDILARHGARATFFVLGSLVERHPDLFQRIVSEGHTVANHTWNHENLARLSRAEFDKTISRTQEILGDHATPCLRPPYAATGTHTREWAADYGLEVFLWTVSANDWLGLNAWEIADRIVSQVTDGSIVLMHDGGGNPLPDGPGPRDHPRPAVRPRHTVRAPLQVAVDRGVASKSRHIIDTATV